MRYIDENVIEEDRLYEDGVDDCLRELDSPIEEDVRGAEELVVGTDDEM